MKQINAACIDYLSLNKAIRESDYKCHVFNCLGQRFIGVGSSNGKIILKYIGANSGLIYILSKPRSYVNSVCIFTAFPTEHTTA